MKPQTKQVTQQNFHFLPATILGQHTPKHPPGFRDCLTTLGCGLSKPGLSFSQTVLFIVSGRHQAKLSGFAWFPSESRQKLAISADFFALGFWSGGEERGKVHSKIEAMSKNKSLRTSPAKTTKGWHRALGTETTAIFLSPMVSRDYVVSDSAVGKCLRGAPQTGGGLNGQEANWLLLVGSCPPTLRTSAVKSPAHTSAAKAFTACTSQLRNPKARQEEAMWSSQWLE